MNIRTVLGGATAAAALTVGAVFGGSGSAAAQPGDFGALPVDPNLVTDSQAFSAQPLVFNPNGQPGVQAVYNHRNGGMQITSTVLVLSDNQAADAAIGGFNAGGMVNGGQPKSVPVGSNGTVLSGMSPDGTQSVSVLTFTQGNTATMIEFDGPPKDPAPIDLVTELGQKQDTAIKDWQA